MSRTVFKTYQFALVICRNFDGRFLAVNETENRGWWIPGGGVDAGESFEEAALRETREEAGMEIELKGILKVDHMITGGKGDQVKMRVIFFAVPKDEHQKPKSFEDEHSISAEWVTLEEFKSKKKIRGSELLDLGGYIESGGQIFPLSALTMMFDPPRDPKRNLSFFYPSQDSHYPLQLN